MLQNKILLIKSRWQSISKKVIKLLIIFPIFFGYYAPNKVVAADFIELTDNIFSPFQQTHSIAIPQNNVQILSRQDQMRYKRIFMLQDQAQWKQAETIIRQLEDKLLLGYVKFQKLMHPTGYRASFNELADWLNLYADHLGADRIYRLARKRKPKGNPAPLKRPIKKVKLALNQQISASNVKKPQNLDKPSPKARSIQQQIKKNVAKGLVSISWAQLKKKFMKKQLNKTEYIQSLGDIAKGYVLYNVDHKALEVAQEALKINPNYPSQSYWWAGLAAWRLQNFKTASEFFTLLSHHPKTQPSMASASSFWAWRAELRQGNITAAHQALSLASEDKYGFYGQLARHALGIPHHFAWEDKPVELQQTIGRNNILQRILALSEAGQHLQSQQEMQRLHYEKTATNITTLIYISDQIGSADQTIKLGRLQKSLFNSRHDLSHAPIPQWSLEKGHVIDQAFLYALILKESHFITHIRSHTGARGLMQIMPGTARMMQKRLSLPLTDYSEPQTNLTLGQEYLKFLLTLPEINYNLIYTLAGYNAGPGRLRDWRAKVNHRDDPLVFMETIPVRETRQYIEKVMSSLWIYRKRLGQETPSLTMILGGKWPLYRRLDTIKTSDQTIP